MPGITSGLGFVRAKPASIYLHFLIAVQLNNVKRYGAANNYRCSNRQKYHSQNAHFKILQCDQSSGDEFQPKVNLSQFIS